MRDLSPSTVENFCLIAFSLHVGKGGRRVKGREGKLLDLSKADPLGTGVKV